MLRARIAVTFAVTLAAACHAADHAGPDESGVAVGAATTPTVARAAPARDFSIGPGLEMRRPIVDGHLTIIPIALTADAAGNVADYLTLDEGMAHHQVTVREIHSYTSVRVRNKSDQPLLLLGGELVLGGAQDHAFSETRVIAARASEEVPVFCVEKGRSAGGRVFHSADLMVDVGLRRVMRYGTAQDVWAAVDKINTRLGLSPPTATYRDAAALQETAAAQARRARLALALRDPRIVGLAVAFDGEVVALDRFTTPRLFRAYQDKLLGSYVAGDDGAHHEGATAGPDDVRRLAGAAAQVRTTEVTFQALTPPPKT